MRLAIPLLASLLSVAPLVAQTQPAAVANVPTTKILAIGSLTSPDAPAAAMNLMQQEVPATVRLFLAGKIDSWYSRKDVRGVVFLMNVGTVEEAHALLEKLPLGVAGLMKFDLIPVGPLGPLNVILPPAPAAKP